MHQRVNETFTQLINFDNKRDARVIAARHLMNVAAKLRRDFVDEGLTREDVMLRLQGAKIGHALAGANDLAKQMGIINTPIILEDLCTAIMRK
jgi:hypothetical protein